MKPILIEISPGELFDRMSILKLKVSHQTDPHRRTHLQTELNALLDIVRRLPAAPDREALVSELDEVNAKLWSVEDDLRLLEEKRDFGQHFVDLARAVYIQNDRRSELRKRIDRLMDASSSQEKIYRTQSPP